MPATREDQVALILYAPALVRDDDRPVAVVQSMERAFPGLSLAWTVSNEGQFTPLPQRDAWLAQGRPDGGFPLICNGNADSYVSVTGWEKQANIAPGRQAQLEVHVAMTLAPASLQVAADVLEAVAEAARAFWGHATPFKAGVDIARQTKDPSLNPPPPPRGLPPLKLSWHLPSPEIPQRLGWLNYWSAAAARTVGFPDPARDEDLLSRARRTATGGWIVQLTQAPLELDNPSHLDALLRAYERFPVIGGRAAPR